MIFILPGWYKHNSLFSNDHLHTSIDFSNRSWWDRIRVEIRNERATLRRERYTHRETFFSPVYCLTDSMVYCGNSVSSEECFKRHSLIQAASFMFEGYTHSIVRVLPFFLSLLDVIVSVEFARRLSTTLFWFCLCVKVCVVCLNGDLWWFLYVESQFYW